MADKIPVKATFTNSDVTGLAEFISTDTVGVSQGGTGATSASGARTNLGAIGADETVTLTNKTLTSPVLNTGVSGTAVLDEDDMATDSATQLATQQSIKAYVDARILTEDTIAELNDTTITSASDGHFLVHTGSAWVNEAPATALASLGVTSTAAELNLLDGVSGLVQADLTKLLQLMQRLQKLISLMVELLQHLLQLWMQIE